MTGQASSTPSNNSSKATGSRRNQRRNDNKKKKDRKRLVRQLLWKEAWKEAVPLGLGSIAMLVSSLANQALPRVMGRLIDQKNTNNNNNASSVASSSSYSLGWVILGGGLASLLRTMLLNTAEGSIASRLRQDAVQALFLRKDLQWFQQQQDQQTNSSKKAQESSTDPLQATTTSGDAAKTATEKKEEDEATTAQDSDDDDDDDNIILSPAAVNDILNEDVSEMAKVCSTLLANLLRSLSAVTWSTYHMISLDAGLLGISAAIVPVVGAVAMILRKSVQRLAKDQRALASEAAAFVEERLQHLMVVKLSNRQADEVAAYRRISNQHLHTLRAQSWQSGAFMGFLFAASSSALLLVVHYGGKSVAQGKLTPGQLTSFTTYSFLLGLGTSGIVQAMGNFTKGLVSADRYYRLVAPHATDAPVEEEVSDAATVTTTTTTTTTTGESTSVQSSSLKSTLPDAPFISLEKVNFSFRSTGTQVLYDISFALPRGQVIALVGRNGSGKSTLAQVLAGLYPPTSGKVTVSSSSSPADATNRHTIKLAQLDTRARQRLVQLIPQASALFNMSILENVRYMAPDATVAQVEMALKLANCENLVSNKPGGLEFVVGLNGNRLSGGERQRLCLARALLSDPALLIMDEPSASLDAEGGAAVEEVLTMCRRSGRSLLLITHQAKSLALVDSLIVLMQGKIIERGTFAELTKSSTSALCRLMPELL